LVHTTGLAIGVASDSPAFKPSKQPAYGYRKCRSLNLANLASRPVPIWSSVCTCVVVLLVYRGQCPPGLAVLCPRDMFGSLALDKG